MDTGPGAHQRRSHHLHVEGEAGGVVLFGQLHLHRPRLPGPQGVEGLGQLVRGELELDLVLVAAHALDVVLVEEALLVYLSPHSRPSGHSGRSG